MASAREIRRTGAVLAFAFATAPLGAADPPALHGWVSLSGGSFDSPPSWIDEGIGKLSGGGLPGDADASAWGGEARLAIDWEPGVGWRLFAHLVARFDSEERSGGEASGLLEAYGERRFGFGAGHEIVLRLGQFLLPTSRENVDPLWASRYTLTNSALNSWIGDEIRPIGLDVSYRKTAPSGAAWSFAGTAFGGNDTAGTLLAWRGFAFHSRLTPTGRDAPLPADPRRVAAFPVQDVDGTRPFGDDLDGRPGWAARARFEAADDRGLIQVAAFDNRGDRAPYGNEYSWETDFRWGGAEVALPAGFRLLGEWGTGSSYMGFAPPGSASDARVDVDFHAGYLLLTWERGAIRMTARYDDFDVDDHDSTAGDDNREEGDAWTGAILVSFGEPWRAGVEWTEVHAERPGAAPLLAGSPDLDGRSLLLELRYRF